MFNRKNLILVSFVLISLCVRSQNKPDIKFGQVDLSDFDLSKNSVVDSSDGAVIISDVGSTAFHGNDKGWFSPSFKRSTRIKIISKNAFDLATIKIILYTSGNNKESLKDLSATTYNVENGKVVSQGLGKKDVFEEKLDKNHIEKKFTLPAVKEGSIIEFSYAIESAFDFRLPDWTFQSARYPCLWSEYKVSIPGLLDYAIFNQGADKFYIKDATNESVNYRVIAPESSLYYGALAQEYNVNTYNAIYHWAMKDLRPLKEEAYISTVDNYIDKIGFQLKSRSYDGQNVTMVTSTWTDVAKELLSDDYAEILSFNTSDNGDWYKVNIAPFIKNQADTLQTAKDLFHAVQNALTSTGDGLLPSKKLYQLLQSKSGNQAEINLLLIALLRMKDITAEPLILSTRENGYLYNDYPILDKINYLVCKATINNTTYYLDASVPLLGFGTLPYECYNGFARSLNFLHADSVYLTSNNLQEQKITNCVLSNAGDGSLNGTLTSKPGKFESFDIRKELKKLTPEEYGKEVKLAADNVSVKNFSADSLVNLESNVSLKYDLNLSLNNEEIIYFTPVLLPSFKSNPFIATNRFYPVEMPYCVDKTYILDMEIPKGYKIDQLPKSEKTSLNQNEGMFEYLIQQSGDHIQLRCRTKLNKATFEPGDYQTLRNFFAFVVKKESEQIIFKKQ